MSQALEDRRNRIAFSQVAWNEKHPSDIRIRMVDDLMKSHSLIGKSRQEIIALLGDPDGDPAVKPRFPEWQMHYYLGPTRGSLLSIDIDYLVLRLDKEGRVTAVDIVTLKT